MVHRILAADCFAAPRTFLFPGEVLLRKEEIAQPIEIVQWSARRIGLDAVGGDEKGVHYGG